jgi:hypothetical protein
MRKLLIIAFVIVNMKALHAQEITDPKATEVWEPVPKVVASGNTRSTPPDDAIILFDGKSLGEWVSTNDISQPAAWDVSNGTITVRKGTGNIQTSRLFTDYQLHLEFRIPENITGEGQARGNSGLFLAATGPGDEGYEIQILDSYENKTYSNGQVGAIYKQHIPLANPSRKPGEWQTYDIVWTAPRFNEDGSLQSPGRVTAFLNGILVQNNVEVKGVTVYIGKPYYKKHGPAAIKLQDHGDPSEPISFKNIWIRVL